ncbi:MAG TPA: hypothetical protein VML93_22190, partial [Mycobacterium sp.]|nr:hypothetical protein [Mycobacterium sp.]
PSGHPQFIGWCLDEEDLCVAKLYAFRAKDQNFVQALIQEHLVDPIVIIDRLGTVNARYTSAIETATRGLAHQIDHGPS